jgi:hypothetical protein
VLALLGHMRGREKVGLRSHRVGYAQEKIEKERREEWAGWAGVVNSAQSLYRE